MIDWGRLRGLGFTTYAQYLGSPHWISTRQRYRDSDLSQECFCGETEGIQLHHKTYERLGEELLTDLAPLCDSCHGWVHALEKRGDLELDLDGLCSEERAAAYADARRVAIQRAESEFNADYNAFKQAQRALPPHERLGLLISAAEDAGIDISSPLRVVERQIRRMEKRCELAASGAP